MHVSFFRQRKTVRKIFNAKEWRGFCHNQSGGAPGVAIKVWVMNQQTSPIVADVPPTFLDRFGDFITGVLSGFDGLRLLPKEKENRVPAV